MMRFIGKNFVKGAASFALLLALGAGLGTGNLMASTGGAPGNVISAGIGSVPQSQNLISVSDMMEVPNDWKGDKHFDGNVNVIKSVKNTKREVISVDFGTLNVVVAKATFLENGEVVHNTQDDVYSHKKNGNINLNFRYDGKDLLISGQNANAPGGKCEISYDECMRAFLGEDTKHAFYKSDNGSAEDEFGRHHFMKVMLRRTVEGCAMIPLGMLRYLTMNPDGSATYEHGTFTRKLPADKCAEFKEHVKLSCLKRVATLCASNAHLREVIEDAKNKFVKEDANNDDDNKTAKTEKTANTGAGTGKVPANSIEADNAKPLISFTCSDALTPEEAGYLFDAFKLFCEAGGECSNMEAAQEFIKSENTTFAYQKVTEMLAAQTTFQYENSNAIKEKNTTRKVIMLNYGYNGLSISGAEHRGDSFTMYSDQYFTDCGGKAIDEAMLADIKKRLEVPDGGAFDSDYARGKIAKELIELKEKLSAQGASDTAFSFQEIEDEDYDGEYSVTKLNKVLEETKIAENFENALRNYIVSHAKDLGIEQDDKGNFQKGNFEIVIVGGSLRIPLLQERALGVLKEYSKAANLERTINMDEFGALGAARADLYTIQPEDANDIKTLSVGEYTKFDTKLIRQFVKLCGRNELYSKAASARNASDALIYKIQRVLQDGESNKEDPLLEQALKSNKEADGIDAEFSKGAVGVCSYLRKVLNSLESRQWGDVKAWKTELGNVEKQFVEIFGDGFLETVAAESADENIEKRKASAMHLHGALHGMNINNSVMNDKIKYLNQAVSDGRKELRNKLIDYLSALDLQGRLGGVIEAAGKLIGSYATEQEDLSGVRIDTLADKILRLRRDSAGNRGVINDIYSAAPMYIKADDLKSKYDAKYNNTTLKKASKDFLQLFKDSGFLPELRTLFTNNSQLSSATFLRSKIRTALMQLDNDYKQAKL